jgi:hypothetical protein
LQERAERAESIIANTRSMLGVYSNALPEKAAADLYAALRGE